MAPFRSLSPAAEEVVDHAGTYKDWDQMPGFLQQAVQNVLSRYPHLSAKPTMSTVSDVSDLASLPTTPGSIRPEVLQRKYQETLPAYQRHMAGLGLFADNNEQHTLHQQETPQRQPLTLPLRTPERSSLSPEGGVSFHQPTLYTTPGQPLRLHPLSHTQKKNIFPGTFPLCLTPPRQPPAESLLASPATPTGRQDDHHHQPAATPTQDTIGRSLPEIERDVQDRTRQWQEAMHRVVDLEAKLLALELEQRALAPPAERGESTRKKRKSRAEKRADRADRADREDKGKGKGKERERGEGA